MLIEEPNSHFAKPVLQAVRVLNLYACLGGNRYKWDEVANIEVTAVEYDAEIAKAYQERFPNDKVIVADAHQYLLDHYKEFDFIWSSPPCPSHSRIRFGQANSERENYNPIYPDMTLYQEIIFLDNYYKGKYVVENVIPYYEPLIKPNVILGRHPFWTNFTIAEKEFKNIDISRSNPDDLLKERGIDMSIFDVIKDVPENRSKDKRFERMQLVRNMVNPEIGLYVLNCAVGDFNKNFKPQTLFGNEM